MAHKTKYGNKAYEMEQPEGWFDPQNYSRNRERYSNYDGDNSTNNYGRADNTMGQDAHSGFPNYRSIKNDYRSDDADISDHRSYLYGDNFEGPVRYKSERNSDWDRRMTRYDDNHRAKGRYNSNIQNRGNYDNRNNDDRNWWDKTTDEVASWFGDDDAERRRRMDKMKGPHTGKGPKGYARTDDRICEDINERLYYDSFIDASEIEVNVSNGEAVLSGTVENRMIKRRVEDIAEAVPGVKDVENHLKVKKTDYSQGSRYDSVRNSDGQDMTNRNWS